MSGSARDHPRVCGEQCWSLYGSAAGSGSSPRVRGAVVCGAQGGTFEGIIPACAGSRHTMIALASLIGDHPRVCGEQYVCRKCRRCNPGSSPRVRGADIVRKLLLTLHGIIPACAGSSSASLTALQRDWDHPRVCGEQWSCAGSLRTCTGSSPRVRGADLKIPAQNTLSL